MILAQGISILLQMVVGALVGCVVRRKALPAVAAAAFVSELVVALSLPKPTPHNQADPREEHMARGAGWPDRSQRQYPPRRGEAPACPMSALAERAFLTASPVNLPILERRSQWPFGREAPGKYLVTKPDPDQSPYCSRA